MKDYIVTVEETYFDATKFEIGGFYLVRYNQMTAEEYKCILTSVSKSKMFLKYYTKDYLKELILSPSDLTSGKYEIKEIKTKGKYKLLNAETDEVVPLSKAKTKYWDLYYNDAEMKVGKCYEVKIGERVYKGFCSYRDSEDITMVLYSDTGTIGAITYVPSAFGKYNDNITLIRFPSEPEIIRNSLTSGVIVKIDRNELKEDRVYFKELV